MRIQKITNNNYQTVKNANSFKGVVNGKHYEDEIIKEARKALKDPNWKDKFVKQKKTASEAIASWHDSLDAGGNSENLASRIAMGISSLGLTEVGFGTLEVIETRQENKRIDKKIDNIKDCMEDMWREKDR